MSDSALILMIREYYQCGTEIATIMLNNAKKHNAIDSLIEAISKTKRGN